MHSQTVKKVKTTLHCFIVQSLNQDIVDRIWDMMEEDMRMEDLTLAESLFASKLADSVQGSPKS